MRGLHPRNNFRFILESMDANILDAQCLCTTHNRHYLMCLNVVKPGNQNQSWDGFDTRSACSL